VWLRNVVCAPRPFDRGIGQVRTRRTTRRQRSTLPQGGEPMSSTSRNFAAIPLLLLVLSSSVAARC
jgi:hypothetical protein